MSPEVVWRALVDGDYTKEYFFGYVVRSERHVGAKIVYEDADGRPHLEGSIIEFDPPRRLRMSARVLRDADTARDAPTRITWELKETARGCRLTVVHDEFVGRTTTYDRVEGGWPTVLLGLKELLETGAVADALDRWPSEIRARALGAER